ncbi:DNA-directed RNA polymerase I 13.1 kDa polypeptide [Paecilomyces variotii No. 5]|uniref:DNA-directed RNA polymerase subunit n=1 Tax=Byssochlamys spectabilis (strain No. 5 / NBRC 109023) TaxID=1356009 RepID=V5I617_BYSSN|nr:DNA-directed RNA polymerase I 13.1 kDa polypeptide [Paecilomyces variotii No. 5]
MSAIGSLIFCTDCGNLLQESRGDVNAILVCDVCGARNRDIVPKTIVSESKPNAFPSALRAKRSAVQTLTTEDRKTEAVAQRTCEKCGRKEMFYTSVQLRSADEGSTIFYSCVCGYKETVQN